MGTHPIFESDFDCLTEWPRNRSTSHRGTGRPKKRYKEVNMDHYYPGEETINPSPGLIEAYCKDKEFTELIITPDTSVLETGDLIDGLLASDCALLVIRSTTELGQHVQIIGELKQRKKRVSVYNEFVPASVSCMWLPSLDDSEHRQSVSGNRSRLISQSTASSLCVSRSTHHLVSLVSPRLINQLKPLITKKEKVLPTQTTTQLNNNIDLKRKKQATREKEDEKRENNKKQ